MLKEKCLHGNRELKSVQMQTVAELEICISWDSFPPKVVDFFNELAATEPRIKVFTFPESPRTGEHYTDLLSCFFKS